jgi:hypothetical protein
MIYCKHCTGKLYEDDTWKDMLGTKYQEIGCYQCSKKLHIEYREWVDFKNLLEKSINKAKAKAYAKSKSA